MVLFQVSKCKRLRRLKLFNEINNWKAVMKKEAPKAKKEIQEI